MQNDCLLLFELNRPIRFIHTDCVSICWLDLVLACWKINDRHGLNSYLCTIISISLFAHHVTNVIFICSFDTRVREVFFNISCILLAKLYINLHELLCGNYHKYFEVFENHLQYRIYILIFCTLLLPSRSNFLHLHAVFRKTGRHDPAVKSWRIQGFMS